MSVKAILKSAAASSKMANTRQKLGQALNSSINCINNTKRRIFDKFTCCFRGVRDEDDTLPATPCSPKRESRASEHHKIDADSLASPAANNAGEAIPSEATPPKPLAPCILEAGATPATYLPTLQPTPTSSMFPVTPLGDDWLEGLEHLSPLDLSDKAQADLDYLLQLLDADEQLMEDVFDVPL